jgi:crotonobetainyl-CoA:carnitine CoA-transferase CaiB-like acyl-CoA transferase
MQGAALIAGLNARVSGGEPRYVPLAMADRITGLMAASAITAALVHQARTGEGQLVEVPMFETMLSFVLGDHLGGRVFDPPLDAGGYGRLLSPDRRPYRTRDGFVCTMIYNDRQWRMFCAAVGWPDLVSTDPRFASHATRTVNIDAVLGMLAQEFLTRTTAEWLALLEAADLPVTPVHTLESIFEDPHLLATGFFQAEDHPTEGRLTRMAAPARFSATPGGERGPAPRLGGDSAAILAEAGVSAEEIQSLRDQGALSGA